MIRFFRIALLELLRIYLIVGAVIGISAYRVSIMCGTPDVTYALRMALTWPAWIRTVVG